MNLHELFPFPEEKKNRKRIGRGTGSGWGCTSGKGHKGQNARSGGGVPAWFEGGQMPLARRLPKRGFKNRFRVEYEVVNLERLLAVFPEKSEISVDDIYSSGICKHNAPIKILAQGEIDKALKVTAHKFSQQAASKIKAAGGEANSIEG